VLHGCYTCATCWLHGGYAGATRALHVRYMLATRALHGRHTRTVLKMFCLQRNRLEVQGGIGVLAFYPPASSQLIWEACTRARHPDQGSYHTCTEQPASHVSLVCFLTLSPLILPWTFLRTRITLLLTGVGMFTSHLISVNDILRSVAAHTKAELPFRTCFYLGWCLCREMFPLPFTSS